MSESLNTLNSLLNENDPTLMVGDGVRRRPGCEASSCSAASVDLRSSTFVGRSRGCNVSAGCVEVAQRLSPSFSEPGRTGRKCSIHLDLSILTILITPECCQPAELGGEYRFPRLID